MSNEEKTPDYFQEWYAENRTSLNDRRRQRYAEDPSYRAKVQQWNREARERRKQVMQKEDVATREARQIRMTGAWKTIKIELDGVLVPMFTIGALARATGKGISTIRVWERNGVLPETPYRTNRGDRLYTVEMVEAVRAALQRAGKLESGAALMLREKRKPPYVVRWVRFDSGQRVRMKLYKIGTLAKAVGRTVVSLTQMEQRRVLPRTPLVASSLEYRLYTLDMIEVVQAAFNRHTGYIRGSAEQDGLYDEIWQGWTKLGITDAKVEDEDESSENSSGADSGDSS